MIELGKGGKREVEDLIAQNGDPKKEQIAFAQSYFAIQTRKQELLEERILLNERLQAREKLAAAETELSRIYMSAVWTTKVLRTFAAKEIVLCLEERIPAL
jgi:hypothetical protein